MSKAVFGFLFFLLPVMAYCQETVFNDTLYDMHEKAMRQNQAKDYLLAYRTLSSLERIMESEIEACNAASLQQCEDELVSLYLPAKKSLAEVAYMLGNHVVARRVAKEMRAAIDSHVWKDSDTFELKRKFFADIAKIEANCYYLTEKYDSAELSLKEALRLWQYDLVDDDFRSKVLADISQLYYKTGRYKDALAYNDSVINCRYYSAEGFSRADKGERGVKGQELKELQSQRSIILARLGRYDEALKKIGSLKGYYKHLGDKGIREYAETLRKKAKILMLRHDATGKYDPVAKNCYQEYLGLAKRYVDSHFASMTESEREQYWMAEQPFVTDCYRLEDKAPELLYDVALFSKAILLQMGRAFTSAMTRQQKSNALSSMRVKWQQVQKAMPPSSTAIEYIAYDKGEKRQIGALILKKTGVPKYVHLFGIDSIMRLRLASGYSLKDVFTSASQMSVNAVYSDKQLQSLIWNERVIKEIGNSKNVFFSPDGIFHQLGIEYLTPDTLSGKKFYRLTSTRMLVYPNRKVNVGSMMMGGYIDYHYSQQERGGADNDQLAYSFMSSKHMELATLTNSKNELDSIVKARKAHSKDTVLTWEKVTEQNVRQLMQRYHIVLLSTHGLFAEASSVGTDVRPALSDVQLSKSCLFLTGAVSNMNDAMFNASNPDGILSARELSQMNLSNVDLTVLSACQTGLGYITPDGVYGLQRGLKAAGVRAVIASLWSVSDEATSILMARLFQNLEDGMSLRDAFDKARRQLREHSTPIKLRGVLKRRIKFNKPYYYDAFILIDGKE